MAQDEEVEVVITGLPEAQNSLLPDHNYSSLTRKNVLIYISGFIQRILIKKERCETCLHYFHNSSQVQVTSDLIEHRNKVGLVTPSYQVYVVVTTADSILTHMMKTGITSQPHILQKMCF